MEGSIYEDAWRRLSQTLREALDGPLREYASLYVTSYVVGIKLVYVRLEGGWCGVSFSPACQNGKEPDVPLLGITPRMLVRLVEKERSPTAAALALAAVNAATSALIGERGMAPPLRVARSSTDVVEAARVKKGDTVIFFGFMRSLAEASRQRGARVYVVELSSKLAREAASLGFHAIFDAEKALKLVRKADVVFFSGSSLLYPSITLTEVQEAIGARERVLVGRTSSFHPLVSRRLGFTIQGGIFIDRSLCWHVEKVVSLGGGLRSPKLRKATVVKWLARLREPDQQ